MKKFLISNKNLFLNIGSFIALAIFFILSYTLFQIKLPFRFFVLYSNQWQGWHLIGDLTKLRLIGYFGIIVLLSNLFLSEAISKKNLKTTIYLLTFFIEIILVVLEINIYLLQFK